MTGEISVGSILRRSRAPLMYETIVPTTNTVTMPIGLIQRNDNRYNGNASDSCMTELSRLWVTFVYTVAHPAIDMLRRRGTTVPAAIAACDPNDIQPVIIAPATPPIIAPILLLHGISMPNVKIPKVVPAAIDDKLVATSKIPPNRSTTNKNTSDSMPRITILLLTIKLADFSDGSRFRQPRNMSSSNTPAVEFKTTDKELNGREINEKYTANSFLVHLREIMLP